MTSTVQPSEGRPQGTRWLVVGIVVAGGIAPLLFYWLLFGQIATLTPQEAKRLLREPNSPAVLVDVRPAQVFAAGHIDGAVNWPLEQVLATARPEQAPVQFRGKTLLLVCDVGMASRWATRHLTSAGVPRVYNVRGGIQEWIRSAAVEEAARSTPPAPGEPPWAREVVAPKGELYDRWRVGPDRVVEFPFRPSPVAEQAAAVIAYFGFKPTYTLLSLLIIVVLWRSRAADLVALRWAMIFFFLGENACAVNYGVFKETSYLFEYLHSLGMLLCFGFTTYAILEGFDRRVLMLSDPNKRCAALALCGRCVKYDDVPCGLKHTFYAIIPALLVVAFMLPTADWQDNAYNTGIFGTLYNYAHLRVFQQVENWYCAAAAVAGLGASLAVLLVKRKNAIATAKVFFAAGMGPLGFGMLRMVLGGAYDQNRVWYLFWEETTELLFILAICFVLWTFRRVLLEQRRA